MSQLYTELKNNRSLFLLAGPCVVEGKELLDEVGAQLSYLKKTYNIPIVFKSSYRKANRSRIDSFTGIGDEKALNLLKEAGEKYQLPVITDIHSEADAEMAADYADVLQIPAFLCRQKSLLEAAAKTNKIVNIKKGQFLSPDAMRFAAQKIVDNGNDQVLLTERGTTFGYSDLVVDMRSFPIMKETGFPTVMDVTHSLQQPNQSTGVTGGQPSLITTIASAAIAAGADGLFIETHPNPSVALSDGANMLALDKLESLIIRLIKIKNAIS